MPRCVIAIHGVGHTTPAEVGGTVAQTLGYTTTRQSTVRHQGVPFVEFRDEATGDTVLEVHWADLMVARATALGVVRHSWHLITSMVNVALAKGSAGRSLLVRAYRFFLFPMTLGAGALTLATAAAVSLEERWLRVSLMAVLLVAIAALTVRLLRFGRDYAILWVWVALLSCVLLLSLGAPLSVESPWVRMGIKFREWGFAISLLLLTLASGQVWFGRGRSTVSVRCALLALLYLPFIAMNGLMAWLGLLGLAGLKILGSEYSAWEQAAYPKYDLWLFELGATVAFSTLGLMLFAFTAWGYAAGKRRGRGASGLSGQPAAEGARDGLNLFLQVTPIVLILLGIYVVLIATTTSRPEDTDIIAIYSISILRTLPFMAWLVGPFALAADLAGDVLFYLQPGTTTGRVRAHPSAIGDACRERLRVACDYATTISDDVVVLAHSQGSKIAFDLRQAGHLSVPLVTCGSPIATLYERFFGESSVGDGGCLINAYRSADVIGGKISSATENVMVGPPDGHTNYWSDNGIKALVDSASRCHTMRPSDSRSRR